jgi:hypothetical protein
MKGG